MDMYVTVSPLQKGKYLGLMHLDLLNPSAQIPVCIEWHLQEGDIIFHEDAL